MITDSMSLAELQKLLSDNDISIQYVRFLPRGWYVEFRSPKKGIFEVGEAPSMVEAFSRCYAKVTAAPQRELLKSLASSQRPFDLNSTLLSTVSSRGVDLSPAAVSVPSVSSTVSVDDKVLQRAKELDKKPIVHYKQVYTLGSQPTFRSLCGAISGNNGKYTDSKDSVTCLRCQRHMKS